MRFFEQRLQPVLELHAVARDLVLAAHHGAPETLLGVGHEAQGQLLSDQALHQPFGIWEVPLAAAAVRDSIALVRDAECAASRRRAVAASGVAVASAVPALPTPAASTARSIP